MNYRILLHPQTYNNAQKYLEELQSEQCQAGGFLYKKLTTKELDQLSVEAFLELLIQTKVPQIFAESAINGDGSDWNLRELQLLGDIATVVPCQIYDNGRHHSPVVHEKPFDGILFYTPGALLRSNGEAMPADWYEAIEHMAINYKGYYQLYERRLLPVLLKANELAKEKNQQAFITIPGLGCGQFAGYFQGQLGEQLKRVLIDLLKQYHSKLPAIKAVYYDPYNECANERHQFGNIDFLVRPLTMGNTGKSQLCPPINYEETGDDFSNCILCSLVAWDHVSWPGNDFYIGARATDDGVKAAATDSMYQITGIEGAYNSQRNTYDPPQMYKNWDAVVVRHNLTIEVIDNLDILPKLLS